MPIRDDLLLRFPSSAATFAGFRAWCQSPRFPEEGRVSFIDGEAIFDMSQEEITTHALVRTELVRVLASINVEEQLGKIIGDGARVVNETANVSNIPDTVFVSFESLQAGKITWTPHKESPDQKIELVGTPDLVCEIVSNSSVVKDAELLRIAYHAAGIPEYWLIDARGDEIVFQILNHRRDGYAAGSDRDGWIKSRTFGRDFRLTRSRDRLGMWEYRLEARLK